MKKSSLNFIQTCNTISLPILNCVKGKKLSADQTEDGGEVTDEDEGAETNRTRASRSGGGQASRRLRICKELSDLIVLNRGSSVKLPCSRDKSKTFSVEI